jgi:HlyD family secretion protein
VLGKLRTLQLTVYLPEDNYGHVKLGQGAHVRMESYPGVVFTGTVTHVADQAGFALRNVQTVEGRRAKVYAIELEVANPDGKLKPGMPADATFE